MKSFFLISILALSISSLATDTGFFVGKILYKHSFTDLQGNDITDKLAPIFGSEWQYYIDRSNYKAYDENGNWVMLYNSVTNAYFSFGKDKTARKIDGSTQDSKKNTVTLPGKAEKIAGYDCTSIQIETDDATIVYYYSPLVKTDPEVFSEHNIGGWNKYLAATGGALPLKFIMTTHKNGFVWTSVASEVLQMNLKAADFEFPRQIKLMK